MPWQHRKAIKPEKRTKSRLQCNSPLQGAVILSALIEFAGQAAWRIPPLAPTPQGNWSHAPTNAKEPAGCFQAAQAAR